MVVLGDTQGTSCSGTGSRKGLCATWGPQGNTETSCGWFVRKEMVMKDVETEKNYLTDDERNALLKKRDDHIKAARDAYQAARRALNGAHREISKAKDAEKEYVRESFLSLGIEVGKTRVRSRKTGAVGVIGWNTLFPSIEKEPGAALGEYSKTHLGNGIYYANVAFYHLKKNGEPCMEPVKHGRIRNKEYLDYFWADSIRDFADHFEIVDP